MEEQIPVLMLAPSHQLMCHSEFLLFSSEMYKKKVAISLLNNRSTDLADILERLWSSCEIGCVRFYHQYLH